MCCLFFYALKQQKMTLSTLNSLRSVSAVTSADVVTGEYDIIAQVLVNNDVHMRQVLEEVQKIPGVTLTLSSLVLPIS